MEIIELDNSQVINCVGDLVKLTIGDYEGYWANEDSTVVLYSGEICLHEEAHLVNDEYYHESEFESFGIVYDHYDEVYALISDCYYGYISYREEGYFAKTAEYVYFNDTYYLDSEVAADCNIYYCNGCDNYYDDDNGCICNQEEEDDDDYCFDYHSGKRKDFSNGSIYKIGFEVEKEDNQQREQDYAHELFNSTSWAKERDGSLGCGGYELISPVFPLDINNSLFTQNIIIDSINSVANYINANYSSSCGGHINISQAGKSSQLVLQSFSAYLPLFYSIYQNRINNTYSKAKQLKLYLNESEKYCSFNCKTNGVLEIRIFPAVKNVTNLLWRAELLRLILKHPTANYKTALAYISNPNNELHQHLRKVFSTKELFIKVKLFAQFAQEIDKVHIKQKNVNRNLVKVLQAA